MHERQAIAHTCSFHWERTPVPNLRYVLRDYNCSWNLAGALDFGYDEPMSDSGRVVIVIGFVSWMCINVSVGTGQ
jgi:hypothetical protein